MKNTLFFLLMSLLFTTCAPQYKVIDKPIITSKAVADIPTERALKRPKNIILMIGDGMGLTQISAGYYMNNGQLNLLKFPYVGIHINNPAEDSTVITDSAAGATAFSIGLKTYNGAIGVDKDSLPRETI